MRLLRCHIENFGVLSGFDYEFAQGLSVICRENGFGKSTLAAFLKAMFYGLPRTGARNVTENERRRFEPWQGGKFGGFLEFEYQGAEYRVTRYFGKTAAKDTFSLRDLTNRTDETPFSSARRGAVRTGRGVFCAQHVSAAGGRAGYAGDDVDARKAFQPGRRHERHE